MRDCRAPGRSVLEGDVVHDAQQAERGRQVAGALQPVLPAPRGPRGPPRLARTGAIRGRGGMRAGGTPCLAGWLHARVQTCQGGCTAARQLRSAEVCALTFGP